MKKYKNEHSVNALSKQSPKGKLTNILELYFI